MNARREYWWRTKSHHVCTDRDGSQHRTIDRRLHRYNHHRYNHHRHHTAIGGPPTSRVTNVTAHNA
jgi:hypothetical protein